MSAEQDDDRGQVAVSQSDSDIKSLLGQLDVAGVDLLEALSFNAAGVEIRDLLAARRLHGEGVGQVSRFVIHGLLGQGGCGSVFKAYDPQLERWVALKMPLPHLVSDGDYRKRFLFEARAMARLSHPNIVPVYETGESSDSGSQCYIASELCLGPSLAHYLAENESPLESELAAHSVALLADSLHHVHQAGIVHRDIKPSNILLFPKREGSDADCFPFVVKLTDFGLARNYTESRQHSTTEGMVGTVKYMSPEQVQGLRDQVGPATDIFALGVVLYEMIAGRAPFESKNSFELCQRIVSQAPPPLPKSTPASLAAICQQCMEKDPRDRYATAGQLASDLRSVLGGNAPEYAKSNRRRRRTKLLRLLATTATLSAVLIAALFLRTRSSRNSASNDNGNGAPAGSAVSALTVGNPADGLDDRVFDEMLDQYLSTGDDSSMGRMEVFGGKYPITWWKHPDTGLTHGYQLIPFRRPITWEDAGRLARQLKVEGMQGRLATITHPGENEMIYDKFIRNRPTGRLYTVWIGLSRPSKDEPWTWTTGEPFEFADWHPKEPGEENFGVYEIKSDDNGILRCHWGTRNHDELASRDFLVEYTPDEALPESED